MIKQQLSYTLYLHTNPFHYFTGRYEKLLRQFMFEIKILLFKRNNIKSNEFEVLLSFLFY